MNVESRPFSSKTNYSSVKYLSRNFTAATSPCFTTLQFREKKRPTSSLKYRIKNKTEQTLWTTITIDDIKPELAA